MRSTNFLGRNKKKEGSREGGRKGGREEGRKETKGSRQGERQIRRNRGPNIDSSSPVEKLEGFTVALTWGLSA